MIFLLDFLKDTVTTHELFLSLLSVAVVKTITKSNLDGMGGLLSSLHNLNHNSFREAKVGAQAKNLKVGTKAETIEECCLLACSSWHDQFASLYIQDCLHRECRLGILHLSSIKKMPHNLTEAFSQLRFLFPGNSSLFQIEIKQAKYNQEKVYFVFFPVLHLTEFGGYCSRSWESTLRQTYLGVKLGGEPYYCSHILREHKQILTNFQYMLCYSLAKCVRIQKQCAK